MDNKGSKTFIGCNNDGQQNTMDKKCKKNSINVNAISKQNALISEKNSNWQFKWKSK